MYALYIITGASNSNPGPTYCWKCDSVTDPWCKVSISRLRANSKLTVKCLEGYCQKKITDGVWVQRSCVTDCAEKTTNTDGVTTQMHCCKGFMCNAGCRSIPASASVIVIMSVVSWAVVMFEIV